MIIGQTKRIPSNDISHFAWLGLRRFQNVGFVADRIARYQSVPDDQRRNLDKQAAQIRACIIQSEEYFRAASIAGMSTKPLLLYYGAMSLALSEILIKQSGDSSLDRARAHHAHHGLDLKITGNPSVKSNLADSASLLRAAPVSKSGGRFGTFELWHRTSRESPLSGKVERFLKGGGAQSGVEVIAIGEDKRLIELPDFGISLFDCFRRLPTLRNLLMDLGVQPLNCRGSVSKNINYNTDRDIFNLTLHPSNNKILLQVCDGFKFVARDIENVNIFQFPSGISINYFEHVDEPSVGHIIPFGFQQNDEKIVFAIGETNLNEFGLMYTALFILGNYARYYPDFWMKDIERSSELFLLVQEFITVCEYRVPITAFSELMQTWYLEH